MTLWVLYIVGFLMAEAYLHVAWWIVALFIVPLIAVRRSVDRERVTWLAAHDPLTGLVSRRSFESELDVLLGSGAGAKHTSGLLLIDLDRFKAVNDTHGHATGDLVLQEVAARLTAAVRHTDTVARIGGDEFAVIVRDAADEATLKGRAEAIVQAVQVPIAIGSLTVAVGASVGGVWTIGGSPPRAVVLAAADRAMYLAKQGQAGARIEALFDVSASEAPPTAGSASGAAGVARTERRRPVSAYVVIAIFVGLLAASATFVYLGPRPGHAQYYDVTLPNAAEFGSDAGTTLFFISDDGSGRYPIPRQRVASQVLASYWLATAPATITLQVSGPYYVPAYWRPTEDQAGTALRLGTAAGLVVLALLLLVGLPARARPAATAFASLLGRQWERAGRTKRAKIGSGLLAFAGSVTGGALWLAAGITLLGAVQMSGLLDPARFHTVTVASTLSPWEVQLVSFVIRIAVIGFVLALGTAVVALAIRTAQPTKGVGAFLTGFAGVGLAAVACTGLSGVSQCAEPAPWWGGVQGMSGPLPQLQSGLAVGEGDALRCVSAAWQDGQIPLLILLAVGVAIGAGLIYREWRTSLPERRRRSNPRTVDRAAL